MDDASLRALQQRLDADTDVVLAWLVRHPAAWLPEGEQLPPALEAIAQTQMATAS